MVVTAPKYAAPPGGWGNVQYPPGTGSNLQHYPSPRAGWGNVHYPAGTGANLIHYSAPPGGWRSIHYRAPLASRKKIKQVTTRPEHYASPPRAWGSVAYPIGPAEKLPSYNAPPGGWVEHSIHLRPGRACHTTLSHQEDGRALGYG